jgi:hypothetical protein
MVDEIGRFDGVVALDDLASELRSVATCNAG